MKKKIAGLGFILVVIGVHLPDRIREFFKEING